MEHVEYVYTTGMDEAAVDRHLREEQNAVLALAAGDDAYAVPLSYHYDGERLLLRVSTHDDSVEKQRFLGTTDRATLVLYDDSSDDSWSIHVRGPVEVYSDDVDEATINEWFPPFRLFDEPVEDVEFTLYELEMDTVIGRTLIG
jgi:nitroimidazol reductase NimA-like FMN-containing flavoprotein (pyridoxamine 5'-phosphate oxidase superfamily)